MARMNSGASRDRDGVMWLDAEVVMTRINTGASRHHHDFSPYGSVTGALFPLPHERHPIGAGRRAERKHAVPVFGHYVASAPRIRWSSNAPMDFELIGSISAIELIATGSKLREARRLRRDYGPGRWVKRKGIARIRLADGTIRLDFA